MNAIRITPEDCFTTLTKIDPDRSFSRCDIAFVNGWSIRDIRPTNVEFQYFAWSELCVMVATIFHRKKGDRAGSSICGLKLGDMMVFFDHDHDRRAEFHSRINLGEISFLPSILKEKHTPTESKLGLRPQWLVWFMTFEGTIFFSYCDNHTELHQSVGTVQKRDIVAAGRVSRGMSTNFIWHSDLLGVYTPEAIRPCLERFLVELKN